MDFHASTKSGPVERTSDDPFSFLKLIAEGVAVFVALSFVTGWSYLASYYKTFGLNPVELELPVPVVATIALHMLYDSAWPILTVAAVLAVLAAGAHRVSRRRENSRALVVAALLLMIFCSGVAAVFRGRRLATRDMLEESSGLPFVAFCSKAAAAKLGPPEQPSCVAFESFGDMGCKLLLHSKGLYYFFRPIPRSRADITDKVDVYILSESEVTGAHIQRSVDLHGLNR